MTDADLQRLITAVQTGNDDAYHGDVKEGVIDALNELQQTREKVTEVQDILKQES